MSVVLDPKFGLGLDMGKNQTILNYTHQHQGYQGVIHHQCCGPE
jgi:hypothetical protein